MRQNNKFYRSKYGASTIEVMGVVVLLLAALLAFSGYIQRALSGKWKQAGDVFSSGKQYDPRGFGSEGISGGTLDCFLDTVAGDTTQGQWIEETCYRNNCNCTWRRFDGLRIEPEYGAQCNACKATCAAACVGYTGGN